MRCRHQRTAITGLRKLVVTCFGVLLRVTKLMTEAEVQQFVEEKYPGNARPDPEPVDESEVVMAIVVAVLAVLRQTRLG